jgi:hypothetical protein
MEHLSTMPISRSWLNRQPLPHVHQQPDSLSDLASRHPPSCHSNPDYSVTTVILVAILATLLFALVTRN